MKLYTITGTPIRKDDSREVIFHKLAGYTNTVAQVLQKYGHDGFTIYQVQGYWKGVAETSFKIELAVEDTHLADIDFIAMDLRDIYEQDCVMVTDNNGEVKFI